MQNITQGLQAKSEKILSTRPTQWFSSESAMEINFHIKSRSGHGTEICPGVQLKTPINCEVLGKRKYHWPQNITNRTKGKG